MESMEKLAIAFIKMNASLQASVKHVDVNMLPQHPRTLKSNLYSKPSWPNSHCKSKY